MKNHLVSVVMSVYNGEKHLEESIESILKQTFKNFEFIIINDGSTDSSEKIILSYHDKRIRLIQHDHNMGLTQSLNEAILEAKGKYIARMDADDISEIERFDHQIQFLEDNPGYHLVGTNGVKIDDEGHTIEQIKMPITYKQILEHISYDNTFIHSSIMFIKKTVIEIGLYDRDFIYAQDFELWARLCLFYKGANLPIFLHRWRFSQNNISFHKYKIQKFYAEAVRGRYIRFYKVLNKVNINKLKNNIKFLRELLLYFNQEEQWLNFLYNYIYKISIPYEHKFDLLIKYNCINTKIARYCISIFLKIKKTLLRKYQMASLYQNIGRLNKALLIYRNILCGSKAEFRGKILFHIGEIYFYKRNFKKSKNIFDECLKIIPEHMKARYYLTKISQKGCHEDD